MATTPHELWKAKRRRYLCRLKRTIEYKGPDPALQEASVYWLARTLGYYVHNPHRWLIRHQNLTAYGTRDADMTLGFRGLGKTSVGTITRAIKYVIDDPNVRVLFGSDSENAAIRFLREVRAHLQYNRDIIDMFGEFFLARPDGDLGRYREGFATVAQRTDRTISEPTFFCIGIGGQSASYHFDVHQLDDLVTIRNSKTPLQRKNVDDWHGSTLIGAGLPHTRTHFLGTRYYPSDEYDVLETGHIDQSEGALAGAVLRIPAIILNAADEEISNYPERFTIELLQRMRLKMGRYHFNAQMQQDTSAGEGILFNWADFRWYNDTESPPPPRSKMEIYQYSDLAAKRTDTGSFFACVTVGVDVERSRIYVLDLVRERAGMAKQRDRILEATEKWRPMRHGVEAVAMQAGFAEEIQESTFLPVEPVQVEGDKVFRARRISHLVEANKVYFPLDDMPVYAAIRPMLEELTTFPDSEFCDTVDAFVGALTLAKLGGPLAAAPAPEDEDDDEDRYLMANYG